MRLVITRHGETIENTEGIIQGHLPGKLSGIGKAQAKKLGERLASEKLHFIYYSDLARAMDTATEIFKYHPDVIARGLILIRERYLGELQGKSISELQGQAENRSFEALKTEKGETIDDLFIRADKTIRILMSAHPDDNILLVTHGGIGKAIIAILEGLGIEGYTSLPVLHNAGLTIYDINEKYHATRREFNDIDHL